MCLLVWGVEEFDCSFVCFTVIKRVICIGPRLQLLYGLTHFNLLNGVFFTVYIWFWTITQTEAKRPKFINMMRYNEIRAPQYFTNMSLAGQKYAKKKTKQNKTKWKDQ